MPEPTVAASLPAPGPDPWAALFESDASPWALLDLLSKNAIPEALEPARAATLLGSLARRVLERPHLVNDLGSASVGNPEALAFPSSFAAYWPPSDAAASKPSVGEGVAHLMGRLAVVAQNAGMGEFDALDAALQQQWVPVVRQILQSFPPAAASLEKRRALTRARHVRDALPWAHQLAACGRVAELKDWLNVPGIHASLLDRAGCTALFHARTPEAVEALLKAGADPAIVSKQGLTAEATWAGEDAWKKLPVAAMKKVLDAHRPGGQQPGSEVPVLLASWLKYGPDDIASMPPERLSLLESIRTRLISGKTATDWGTVGYLGMNLPSFYHVDETYRQRWQAFLDNVPNAWLTHESIPGVADGWVLAVAFNGSYERCNEAAKRLAQTIEMRMMALASPDQKNVFRAKSVVAATGVMLAHATKKEEREEAAKWVSRWVNDSDSRYSLADTHWPSKPSASLWAAVLVQGLAIPALRPFLTARPTLLENATPALAAALTDADTTRRFWTHLLVTHAAYLKENVKYGELSGDAMRVDQAFHKVETSLMNAGALPDALEGHQVQTAITKLRRHSPKMVSMLNAVMMNSALPEPEAPKASSARRRM